MTKKPLHQLTRSEWHRLIVHSDPNELAKKLESWGAEHERLKKSLGSNISRNELLKDNKRLAEENKNLDETGSRLALRCTKLSGVLRKADEALKKMECYEMQIDDDMIVTSAARKEIRLVLNPSES